MTRFFLRIITDCCTRETEQEIAAFLRNLCNVMDIHMEPIVPYWKHPEQGEIQASFVGALPTEAMQSALADHWEGENADSRWSRIHVPHAAFLWLTF